MKKKQPLWANIEQAQQAHHWLQPEHLQDCQGGLRLSEKGIAAAQKRFQGIITKAYNLSLTNAPLFAKFKAENNCKDVEIDELYLQFGLWLEAAKTKSANHV